MTAYTRVTLVGASRRVDMVLPATEPVGQLLPDTLAVAGEPIGHPAKLRNLVTADGTVLSGNDTLQGAGIVDGTVLRLAGAEDLPPAPVVHDVTEETADDLDSRALRWGPAARWWTATAGAAFVAAAAGSLAYGRLPEGDTATGLGVTGAVLAAGGVACARARRPLGAALIGAGGVLVVLAAWAWGAAAGWPIGWRLLAVAAAVGLAVLLSGLNAARGRAALVGGASVLGWAGLWAGLAGTGVTGARLGAVIAVVAVVVLGLLPRWALSWSGLAMLDDRRVQEQPVARRDVQDALAAAHGSLVIAVCGCVVAAAAAGGLLAFAFTGWSITAALLLVVVLVVRCRTYPLAAQVVGLIAAATVIVAAVWWRWSGSVPVGVGLAVAGLGFTVPVAALVMDPAEHVRARLRRIGDLLESAAVIALLPVVLGVFGVYSRLLEAF